jgi:hypothetical protein
LDHVRALYYGFQNDLSNGVSHAPIEDHLTVTLGGFVVKSQIPNLIPNIFFYHNSCIWSMNEQCKGILGIYISRNFPWYHESLILGLFCLSNQGFEHLGFSHQCSSQSENALGSHWVPSLHSLSFVKMSFTFQHTFLASWTLAFHI